jgi:hypothetical protein
MSLSLAACGGACGLNREVVGMLRRCLSMRTACCIAASLLLIGLAGCRAAPTAASAPQARVTPMQGVTHLGAGDALGLALHEHYVMVATLRGEAKPVAVTRK